MDACPISSPSIRPISRLTGIIALSLLTSSISAPEYPPVLSATDVKSSPTERSPKCFRNIASLAPALGSGTKTLFSSRRSTAMSKSHGRLLAAMTKTCSEELPPWATWALAEAAVAPLTPSICISNSVFIRLEASCSPPSPSLDVRMESISSRNIVLGPWYLATSNSTRTSFSLSPRHLETNVEADMLKKVVLHSVATAFASSVLPVPGGPCRRMPRQGRRIPVNR
mmetsp:Transcript_10270/g.22796  ORF Transcript_10270/g.22796 Transcript_10270/m.22796 type:complete len:226 (-) Transcript_10270:650-1327(-)